MGIYAYPPEIEDFVRQMAPLLRDRELAVAANEKFGTEFTADKMKSYRGNHGIRNYKKQLSHEEYWKYQTRWPAGCLSLSATIRGASVRKRWRTW